MAKWGGVSGNIISFEILKKKKPKTKNKTKPPKKQTKN